MKLCKKIMWNVHAKNAFSENQTFFSVLYKICQFIPSSSPRKMNIFVYQWSSNNGWPDSVGRRRAWNQALGTILPLSVLSAPIPPSPRIERLWEAQLFCLLLQLFINFFLNNRRDPILNISVYSGVYFPPMVSVFS